MKLPYSEFRYWGHVSVVLVIALGLIYTILVIRSHTRYLDRYSYTSNTPICKTLTLLLQPVMENFFDDKITHSCHWKNISRDIYDFQSPLILNRNQVPQRRLGSNSPKEWIRYVAVELGQPKTISVQPVDYDGHWKLVFYDPSSTTTQESILIHTGPIRILSDGESHYIGITNEGKQIDLEQIPGNSLHLYI